MAWRNDVAAVTANNIKYRGNINGVINKAGEKIMCGEIISGWQRPYVAIIMACHVAYEISMATVYVWRSGINGVWHNGSWRCIGVAVMAWRMAKWRNGAWRNGVMSWRHVA